MIFRLSQKLAKKIKETGLRAAPLDENPYADWSANLFTADRTQYIMVTNTKSLYSVVMYGRGTADYSQFINRALCGLRDFMEDDGLIHLYQRFIAPATGSIRFAKALDRSVTGSINELIRYASYYLESDEISPFEIGFKLNTIPFTAIAEGEKAYGKPKEAFIALGDVSECSLSLPADL